MSEPPDSSDAIEHPRGVAEAICALLEHRDDADTILCQLLDMHAVRTGRNAARHAGRILRGAVRSGRTAIDDSVALRYVAELEKRDRRSAAGKVARWLAGPDAEQKEVEKIAQRLRFKRRKWISSLQNGATPES